MLHHQSMEEISLHYDGIWTKKGYKSKDINSELKAKLGSSSLFPQKISAQLATLVDKAPQGDEWLHEVKLDGYRMFAVKKGKDLQFFSRNEKDWTKEFKSLIPDIQKLPLTKGIFDGEIVILDKNSRSNFQLLQNAIKSEKNVHFYYYIFDLLYLEKYDLRSLPLIERKTILASLLQEAPSSIKYSNHIVGHGEEMLERACEFDLEGIVSKRVDSRYIGKRNKSWLKIKCSSRQEFVVGGFSKPKRSREYFGSLYLGVFNEEGELVFTGNVGTGFSAASLKAVYDELKPLISKKNPFRTLPPEAKVATWVEPKLVVEVEFSQWTQEGRLRHPSFKGLRMDKKSKEVTAEKETSIEAIKSNASLSSSLQLTHPEKILYKEDKITKQDLYHYYDEISDYILPYISHRPLTLVRCPSGYEECFYQKHLNKSGKKLHSIPVENKNGTVEQYIYLDNKAGLLNLVQMGVLEIHPWGSKIEHLEYPDILIFDLDPGPDVEWKMVVEAAFDIKEQLRQYQLRSFVKTTGGKGLHIVIPIKPEFHWDEVKNFTRIFAEYLEKRNPEKYVSKMAKVKRKGKIFVDYLRNQHDATAIAPYSTRARLHAPVATPISWDELSDNFAETFYTVRTLPKRLAKLKSDPWKEFYTIRQSLRLDELE
ncbi:DNA ligase D [Legionella sp.]|uniref:DNA ligase D n=1 Tax=Legionella sp. TaxID=459 RepID=UPI00257A634A|nr:DNA ligase D [Legionella sp.]